MCAHNPLSVKYLHGVSAGSKYECSLKSHSEKSDRFGAMMRSSSTPTVYLDVTSAVACTYGYGDGRIGPTRCAVIAGALGDRWSRRQGCSTPPAGARSARSGRAARSEER